MRPFSYRAVESSNGFHGLADMASNLLRDLRTDSGIAKKFRDGLNAAIIHTKGW